MRFFCFRKLPKPISISAPDRIGVQHVGLLDQHAAKYSGSSPMSHDFRHARLLQQFRTANGTIEDLARAWASMDGKREIFDAEKNMSMAEVEDGAYLWQQAIRRSVGGAVQPAHEKLAEARARSRLESSRTSRIKLCVCTSSSLRLIGATVVWRLSPDLHVGSNSGRAVDF